MARGRSDREWRGEIFRHLDGIVVAPTAFALHERGVLATLLDRERVSLAEVTDQFRANEGYLNVALRVLCSQGWLAQDLDNARDIVYYRLTAASAEAFALVPHYADAVRLLQVTERYHSRKFEVAPFRVMQEVFAHWRGRYGLPNPTSAIGEQVLRHIEGIIVGPTAVHLGMSGMFHKYFMEASFRPDEFHRDPESFGQLLSMFATLGWFEEHNGTFRFTDKGLFLARRASAYGVTVSYIPTLRKLDQLIFGDPVALRHGPTGAPEEHVDREMNVWGSGGAHSTYFKRVDEIVIELFNRPLADQPKGILDMGCGNGAFLAHLYDVIERQTLRGRHLDAHPLFLVGVDYNNAALKVARQNLIQADIWAKVMWGDIGKPDVLAASLKADYGIALEDLLNARTFLDHNRVWEPPSVVDAGLVATSTGAFAHRGRRVANNLVEASLTEHLRRWTPYVGRFGLLVIELHTISPAAAAESLGETAATAYDGTHGFSDQYIVEYDVFERAARAAGLVAPPEHVTRFPNVAATTVSINLLRAR
jgi:SAM-dependent methyltransferase